MIRHGKSDKIYRLRPDISTTTVCHPVFRLKREAFVSDESSVNLIISTFHGERRLFMIIYGYPTRVYE